MRALQTGERSDRSQVTEVTTEDLETTEGQEVDLLDTFLELVVSVEGHRQEESECLDLILV